MQLRRHPSVYMAATIGLGDDGGRGREGRRGREQPRSRCCRSALRVGDYSRHWLEIGTRGAVPAEDLAVNSFRKDATASPVAGLREEHAGAAVDRGALRRARSPGGGDALGLMPEYDASTGRGSTSVPVYAQVDGDVPGRWVRELESPEELYARWVRSVPKSSHANRSTGVALDRVIASSVSSCGTARRATGGRLRRRVAPRLVEARARDPGPHAPGDRRPPAGRKVDSVARPGSHRARAYRSSCRFRAIAVLRQRRPGQSRSTWNVLPDLRRAPGACVVGSGQDRDALEDARRSHEPDVDPASGWRRSRRRAVVDSGPRAGAVTHRECRQVVARGIGGFGWRRSPGGRRRPPDVSRGTSRRGLGPLRVTMPTRAPARAKNRAAWETSSIMRFRAAIHVIVIGGGHAGTEAALASAQIGARSLLLRTSPRLSGRCASNPPRAASARATW